MVQAASVQADPADIEADARRRAEIRRQLARPGLPFHVRMLFWSSYSGGPLGHASICETRATMREAMAAHGYDLPDHYR